MMIAVQPTVTVFPPQPESIWGVSRVECVATKSSVYYVYCVADSCIMCSQLSTMPLVPVQCAMCITRCKRAKCTMYRKKYRYRYPLTFWVSSHTVVVCSILCAESSVQCSAQYFLHSILCAVFTLPCAVFSVQYSASPSHQINFNYCTDLSSRLVAPRKSIYCGIIILQNISTISILAIFVNYCKCCKSSWLGINLMLSENCEIAPVMTK